MSDHWLYCQDLPAQTGPWTLLGPEAQHARVKRLATGERVHLFDGQGRSAEAEVAEAGRQALAVRILSLTTMPARLPRLCIAVSQPKGERLDWMLEKLTELAVAEIIPLQCQRSVAHAKQERTDRWQRRLVEAAKQSHVAWLPTIAPPLTLPQLVANAARFTHILAADTTDAIPIAKAADQIAPRDRPVIVIGPEGGFSDQERDLMRQARAQTVSLGPSVLRTETAAIVAAGCLLNMSAIRAI